MSTLRTSFARQCIAEVAPLQGLSRRRPRRRPRRRSGRLRRPLPPDANPEEIIAEVADVRTSRFLVRPVGERRRPTTLFLPPTGDSKHDVKCPAMLRPSRPRLLGAAHHGRCRYS